MTDHTHIASSSLSLKGLYGITYPALFEEADLKSIRTALDGGLALLQYRDKQNTDNVRRRQVDQLLHLCQHYHCPLIINDDVELCLTAGADGVHLGQTDGSIQQARQRLGRDSIIGATCHNALSLADKAINEGCSYIAFGRFFPSQSKQEAPPADLSTLRTAKQQFNVPCVAIGGINIDNAQTILDQGADMIALIQGLFGSTDLSATLRAFRQLNWHS